MNKLIFRNVQDCQESSKQLSARAWIERWDYWLHRQDFSDGSAGMIYVELVYLFAEMSKEDK